MTGQTIQSQQNSTYRSRIYSNFKAELSFLFGKKEQSLHDTIHDIITDSSKNIEDIKKKIITKLQSGADINKANPEGKTPVMYLLEKIKELKGKSQGTLKQAARFLIERGADIENTDTESQKQSEDKGQKTLIDKLKNLNFFGHSESITEKDIGSINQSRKILEEKAKGELSNYIEKGVIKEVSIYGNCAQIQLENDDDTKEFKISELLNSDFCKDNGISGFSTLHKDGVSGMHGAVHNNIRHYVVTDGSYEMTLKWYAKGEQCNITIKIDADGSVALTKGNDVTCEQLEAHKDIKLGDLFLAEALRNGRWKDELQQSEETIRSVELQQGQSRETRISAGRGIEANNKSKTHFGHNKGPAPQPPKVSSWVEANNSESNVKTSTPNYNAPLPHFTVSPIPFPAHKLGVLTDDYCEDTGKRTITYNDGSVAVIEDVPDERDSVAAQTQQQPTLLAITYPDGDKKSNTRSPNSLEGNKFASTTTKQPTTSNSPYLSSLPPVDSFKPEQPPSVHTQQQQKAEEVLNEFGTFRNNNVEKTTELTESEFPSDELQTDSGFSSPTHTGKRTVQMAHESVVEESSWLEGSTSGVPLKPVDPRGLSPRTEERLSEDGLREGYSINEHGRTEIFNSNNWPIHSSTTDSGFLSPFSSPRHSVSNESQIDQERLESVAMMLVGLKEPDYNDAELSPEENASISGNQGSEWELECGSSLDSDDEFKERYSGYIDDDLGDSIGTELSNGKYVDELDLDEALKYKQLFGEEESEYEQNSNATNLEKIQGELEERFNQPNKGLKTVEQTAKEVSPSSRDYYPLLKQAKEGLNKLSSNGKRSPQTEAHLIEAGLLPASEKKQSISEINRKTFPVNAGTRKYLNYVTDTYSRIYELVKTDEEQLKVGVIGEGREFVSTEYVNSNDRNRVKSGNDGQKRSKKICGPWTQHFSQQLQEKQQKKQEGKGITKS
ncbi:MAG: hypothetical protein PG981_000160 [Wolbachia endosymbiont of Ctenocephalides orientis wCori]|nr:MAG: hypothetical protein PG981_000160 [Wolbachia endosymbiont of Ctenocephalides orientis wCori]